MIDDLAELDLPAEDALRLSGLGGVRDRIGMWRALLDRPLTSYYLVLGITTLLLGLGLVMVQSTASVADLAAGLSPYSDFKKQLLGAAVGLPLMWVAARSSPRLFRAFAYPLLAVSVVGLCLTLIRGVGVSQNGAARWIDIGGQQIQPSEIAKLALAVWGADLLARKEKLGQLADWRHMLVPLMPGAAVLCLLVMAGDDLGTTFILLVIFLALLWVIGTPGRVFSGMLILMALAMALMIVSTPYRFERMVGFLSSQGGATGANMQPIQGKYARRLGRHLRRRPRRQPGEVGLGAGIHDRLHLRHHRRGTRAGRHAVRDLPVRRPGLRRAADRPAGARRVLPPGGDRHHGLDRHAGPGEHRRGDRLPAHRGGAAAARLRRAFLLACDADRAGHADVVRAAGARRPRGFGRTWPRLAAARSKLARSIKAPKTKRRQLSGTVQGRGMRVLLAGGGSAGHIEPALALADALRRIDPGAEVTCLGTERGLETRLIPLRGYPLELIPAVPMPRSVTPKLLTVPGRLAGAINAAAAAIDRTGAQVLVGFGGYVATPAYLAARRRKIPIVVHEANPKPGLANRLGARFTTHVFTGHPDTQLRNGKYLGIPIRREIAELDRLGLGDKARTHFGLRPDLPVLLVTGGSQGARSLNAAVFGAAEWLRDAGVQVLHIIGPRNGHDAPVTSAGVPYVATSYIDRMDLAYAAADFALCRAGAMTCAELTAVGLPAAYVPLPIGNGEQRLNAVPIVQRGGGMLVADGDLTPAWIRDTLLPVLVNIDQVADMSEAAASLGRGDADRWLAEAVVEIVDGKGAGGGPDAQEPDAQ